MASFLLNLRSTLLLLTFAALDFFGSCAGAAPTVIGYGHATNRFGPHSFPGQPVGDKVQVYAFLDSSDPVGSPTISVEANQGGTTLMLDLLPPEGMFQGYNLFYKFIDFDPNLTGQWEIVPTDSTGTGPFAFTPEIVEPEFLPLVENIMVQGTSLGAKVSWTLPNLAGFDADQVAVRIFETVGGKHLWQSDLLPLQTTSFAPPLGTLQTGVDYVYSVLLVDLQGFDAENASWSYSEPFRLTVAGDYNQNGVVDAADFTVWRDNFGGTALLNRGVGITGPVGVADYGVWKANFGQSLGAGSGAAGYPLHASAASVSAAAPEPAGIVSIALGAATIGAGWRPRCRSRRSTC